MKIQDIVYLIILLALIVIRKEKYALIAGICCLLLAIPLFYLWIFFTAERLTWYAASFFLLAIIFEIFKKK